MSHRNKKAERWALELLNQIVALDKENRDALPGSVVREVKIARRILINLSNPKRRGGQDSDSGHFFIRY